MKLFTRYSNMSEFSRLMERLLPWLKAFTAGMVALGLYLALAASPPDYQQSETVRIMYVHVPAAWMSLFVYIVITGASVAYLVWRSPVSHIVAQSSAGIGACFTFITLATGSLWGKPMWGTWWVWDARLTSVLILLFIYIGYMTMLRQFDTRERAAGAAAIFAIVGAVNIPIIKFSVEWWNTLHQPASVFKAGGPSIHPDMLWPLLAMWLAMMGLYGLVLAYNVLAEGVEAKIRRLQIRR